MTTDSPKSKATASHVAPRGRVNPEHSTEATARAAATPPLNPPGTPRRASSQEPPVVSPEAEGSPGWFPVTNEEFERRMDHVDRVLRSIDRHLLAVEENITQIGESILSTQADVDAIAAELQQEDSDLNAAVAAIQAWINSQPASVDVSGLVPLADALKASVANAAALVPAPAPAPQPPAGG
ncbi:MAG: hypothetical protein JWO67_6476 [Streptosporangiaceae bacterium]|nr:hypothetical protein [Streptosporangiaceae bacterium]